MCAKHDSADIDHMAFLKIVKSHSLGFSNGALENLEIRIQGISIDSRPLILQIPNISTSTRSP